MSIRYATESDIPFIYATTLRCLKHDSGLGKQTRNDVFYRNYAKVLDHILLSAKVYVYCVSEEPSVILGFIICELPNVVHFSFTKEAARGLGIQRKLQSYAKLTKPYLITHKTKSVSWLKDATFNPFLLYQGVKE